MNELAELRKRVAELEASEAERKKAEQEARYQREYFRSLFDGSPEAVVSIDMERRVMDVNPVFEEMFGYSLEDIKGKDIHTFILPQGKEREGKDVSRRSSQGEIVAAETVRRAADGRGIPVSLLAAPVVVEGRQIGILAIYRDISERKKAEAEIENQRRYFQALFQNAPEGIASFDLQNHVIDLNPAFEKMFGYTLKELKGRDPIDYIVPQDRTEETWSIRKKARQGEVSFVPDTIRKRADGSQFSLSILSAPIVIEGREVGNFALFRDISERKKAEEALRESEERFRTLFEQSRDAIYINTQEGRFLDVNQSMLDLFGYTREEMLEMEVAKIYADPAQRESFKEEIAKKGSVADYEARFRKKDGTPMDCLLTATARRAEDGSILGYQGIFRDVTEMRNAESALRKSEGQYRSLFEQSMDAIALVAVDGTLLDANPAYLNMYGYDVADIGRATVKGQYLRATDRDKYVRRMEQRGAIRDEEVKLKKVDGTIMDCLLTSNAMRDETGRIVRFQTVVRDVTEDKRRNDALADELTRRRILLEQSRDGIVVLDQDGKVAEANLRFAQMLGYSLEELLQLHVWDWDVPHPSDRLMEMVRTIDESGDHFETQHRRKDGTVYEVEISTNGAVFAGQKLVFCVCRDITERKRAQEELESSRDELRRLATQLQLVREEERAAVAWELHDEVGQALAALQIDLHWLERRLSRDDTELLEKAQSMSGLIQSNTERLRRLYMELRPGMLDDLGLAATIEWQAEEFQKRTGIKSVVSLDRDAGPRGADYSLAVYRVFQEALGNVTRHAEATEVNISLTKTDNRIVLEIADNGRGITKKQVSAPGSSGLVGMRERLRPWGGKVTITGVPGKGTTVRVSIPVGKGEL